jgi:hypothetical protein
MMGRLLAFTGVVETMTGVALLVMPSVVVELLLGSSLETAALPTLGRVAGAALLALGVACWLARGDIQGGAARGLVIAMMLYNVGVVAILGSVGLHGQSTGLALWPAVVLHMALTVGCVSSLVTMGT